MDYERANSPQAALNLFEEEVVKLCLAYNLASVGGEPKTTRCWLRHADGTVADVGNGKGIGLQSEISAKYEALEHYLSTKKSDLQNESISLSFEEIEGTLSEVNRKALPPCYMKPSNRFKKTPWLSLKGYFGSSIIVPYFLTNPDYINKPFLFDDFDYSTLSDIPTNNGTAIGTSFEEAMIHAVNELIERDAISCFLLSVFGRKNPKKVRIIDKNSLPFYLSETLAMIERDYNDELLIVDIMNDLKFPVFLVTFTKQNYRIRSLFKYFICP